jgi:hypothetical protein
MRASWRLVANPSPATRTSQERKPAEHGLLSHATLLGELFADAMGEVVVVGHLSDSPSVLAPYRSSAAWRITPVSWKPTSCRSAGS